ncbi:MAG TPA: ABC transporter permease subunit [Candidatus Limnocylindrales bacterium]
MSATLPASSTRRAPTRRRGALVWLALAPFGLGVLLFLLLPTLSLVWGSFHRSDGSFTVANYGFLLAAEQLKPFQNSILLSASTMLVGGVGGLLIGQALLSSRSGLVRELGVTFSSVAANFAGVPLAFAFIATLGANGLLTRFWAALGIDLYGHGFTLYNLLGLAAVYSYFQLPLMVLLILPALQAMRGEWREAAENLGASRWYYLRRVAIPILLPSVIASMLLLFANAFGAYATAYALTTGFFPIVPIEISSVISGDVSFDPGQGDVLAIGLAVIMALCVGGQAWLQRRTGRWLER